jgi:hypothetical protein
MANYQLKDQQQLFLRLIKSPMIADHHELKEEERN